MAMTENGISTTRRPGQEQYEYFTHKFGREVKEFCQYDYRHSDGELFSCVLPSLEDCRAARDKWAEQKVRKSAEYICRDCGIGLADEDFCCEAYIVNDGFADEYMLCFNCHVSAMESGEYHLREKLGVLYEENENCSAIVSRMRAEITEKVQDLVKGQPVPIATDVSAGA